MVFKLYCSIYDRCPSDSYIEQYIFDDFDIENEAIFIKELFEQTCKDNEDIKFYIDETDYEYFKYVADQKSNYPSNFSNDGDSEEERYESDVNETFTIEVASQFIIDENNSNGCGIDYSLYSGENIKTKVCIQNVWYECMFDVVDNDFVFKIKNYIPEPLWKYCDKKYLDYKPDYSTPVMKKFDILKK